MLWVVVCVIIIGISVAVRAVRAANRRQEVAGFQSYASTASPAFPLEPGESIVLSIAARDLRAARRLADDAITDEYPSSFPLVVSTSTRLVVQMSVTDRTTDLTGSFPPRTPDLRRRIGEQFSGTDQRVSSCAWPWETISSVLAEGDTTGLVWQSEMGSGAVTLTFMSVADQARFLSTALESISAARKRAGVMPSDPIRTQDGESSELTFTAALIVCSACGTFVHPDEGFCTGCGVKVFRYVDAS